jgi:transcriptional regulator with XRE-family HTH domain
MRKQASVNIATVGDRHATILAMAHQQPGLTCKAIAEKVGVSSATVSLVLRGKRGGKRRLARLAQLGIVPRVEDKEFGAITAVMAAVADLTEAARRRVVNYALQRLSEEHPDAPHFEHTSRARELLSNS